MMGHTMKEEEAGTRWGSFITSEGPGVVNCGLRSHQASQSQLAQGNKTAMLYVPVSLRPLVTCPVISECLEAHATETTATSAQLTNLFDSRHGTTAFILCAHCPWRRQALRVASAK
jgi:hypothetical protein